VAAQNARPGLPAEWWRGAFMEIYVRGYQDSDGDGIGDLQGLIQRLDYLKDLGVSGIWLMPITASQDQDHGYAVSDYRAIEPDYGTLADFDELIKQAHARGIGVIMDYVINHSAADHPIFEVSRSSKDNPYRDWYVWRENVPDGWNIYGKNPWYEDEHGAYFAGFWDQMPEWNLRNPKVIGFHLDNMRFWLNRGLDGFRFDAVGNLVENGPLAWEGQAESHQVMKAVSELVASYPSTFTICEAPGDARAVAREDVCGHSFAFGHNKRLISAALGNPAVLDQVAQYFVEQPRGMSGFSSNHDAFAGRRLWDSTRGREEKYRLAAATYLLQNADPPFIYYGEEIGMAGGKGMSGDHKLRTPMSWSADPQTAGFTTSDPFRSLSANSVSNNVDSQRQDTASLWSFYRDILHLRREHPALLSGIYEAPQVHDWQMAFWRRSSEQAVLVVLNYHSQEAHWSLKDLPAGHRLRALWPKHGQPDLRVASDGTVQLDLPAADFRVFEVLPK
jgi:glycosidase